MDNNVLEAVHNPARLSALYDLALLDHACDPAFDRLTRLATQLLNAPIALVSLVDNHRQFFVSCVGLNEPFASTHETPLSHSFCKHVVASGEPLIIQDARYHPLVRDNPGIETLNIVAYLGFPLTTKQAYTLGSFCVIDTRPRWWSERDIALMRDLTTSVITEIELRAEIAERKRVEATLQAAQADLEARVQASTKDLRQANQALTGQLAEDKRVQEALRASEERFRALFESAPVGIGLSRNGITLYANPRYMQIFGFDSAEELVGRSLLDQIAPHFRAEIAERNRRRENGEAVPLAYQSWGLRKDGSEFPMFVEVNSIELQDGPATVAYITDLSERVQAERAQRASEELFQLVSRATNDVVWDLDLINNRLWWNDGVYRLFGYRKDEIGTSIDWWEACIHPDERETVVAGLQDVINRGAPSWACEYRYRRADGSYAYIYDRGFMIHDAEGRPVRMIGAMMDITERKRAEIELQKTTQQLRMVVTNAPILLFVLDPDGIVTLVEGSILQSMHLAPERLIGRSFFEIYRSLPGAYVDGPEELDPARRALAGEEHTSIDNIGSLTFETRWRPLRDEADRVYSVIGVATDVTEQRKAEAALRESETRFRALSEAAWEGIAIHSNGRTIEVNQRLAVMLGSQVSELLERSVFDFVHPAQRAFAEANAERFVEQPYEIQLQRHDGTLFCAEIRGMSGTYQGRPVRIISVRDLTERKAAEEALGKSEATNRALLDAIPDLLFRMSKDGIFLDYRAPKNLGLLAQPEHFLDKRIDQVLPQPLAQQTLAYITQALATGVTQLFEYELARSDGEIEEFEARLAVCGPDEVLVLVRNITERKLLERKVTAARDVYLTLVEEAPMLVWRIDTTGKCNFVNKQWLEFIGPIGNHSFDEIWRSHLYPDDVARLKAEWAKVAGTPQSMESEYRLRRFDNTYRWINVRISPFYDEHGHFAGYIGTGTDINERKQQEQIKDDFLALASHELKTPLAALIGYMYLLQRWSAQFHFGERVDTALAAMMSEGGRLDRLVNDLLDVSRIQNGKLRLTLRPLDLHEVVPRLIESMRVALPDHPFMLDIQTEGPIIIQGDLQRIEQIVTNLCTNAAKYSLPSMPISIRLRAEPPQVVLTVEDYGLGIPEADLPYIFDRFYQVQRPTRESRPGLGLGLFITHELVRQHGGTITVQSIEHGGSSFTVVLPYYPLSQEQTHEAAVA